MGVLEDLIEEMREQGREDEAGELEKLKGSSLRDKAKNADRLSKENEDLKAEVESLKRGPKVRAAFEKAGINFESLSKLERKAIESYDGDLDDEDIESFIEENELSVDESEGDEPEGGDEEPAAAKVAKAARRSGERKGDPTKVTPQQANDWSVEQKIRFADEHPDEWEALKQGETVTGVKVPVGVKAT